MQCSAICNAPRQNGSQFLSEIKPPPLILSLAEGRVFGETARLLLTLPLLRLQARRGSAEPVIILPGFMADDRSTALLRAFVQSIGYSTSGWLLGTNRLPMMQYLPALRDQMMDLKAKFGGKVHLIGWSRGGMIARELARDYPELVKQVITIGTPVRGDLQHRLWVAGCNGKRVCRPNRWLKLLKKDIDHRSPCQSELSIAKPMALLPGRRVLTIKMKMSFIMRLRAVMLAWAVT